MRIFQRLNLAVTWRGIFFVLIGITNDCFAEPPPELDRSAKIADPSELPIGWKAAKKVKNSGCDRQKSDLLTAIGDFDGDNKMDTAKILVKESGKGLGVWIWLTTQKTPILAATSEHEDGKHDMGIGIVKPGTFDTACGKAYWDCKADEESKIILKNSAVDFFTCESANQYLYWSQGDKKIKNIWISD